MRVDKCIGCKAFPCTDVNKRLYIVPGVEIKPAAVSIVMISEAAPADLRDYYYAAGAPAFAQTTVQAFADAGIKVTSIKDLIKRGIYFTTAVKCGKTGYGVQTATIKECSALLQKELSLFPNVKAYLLMGDVAIKALNHVALREGAGRIIPAGSTYKIRGQKFQFRGARAFPSYLQAGPSFNIEKSKRRMIAEDIAAALRIVK